MKQIVNCFDCSYVINLADRPDRREQVTREFRGVGIDIGRGKVQFLDAIKPTERGEFPDIGSRGCFISHKTVLEIAAKEQVKNVLIFEDDVSFRWISAAFECELVARLSQAEWDLMFFGYLSPSEDGLRGPLVRWRGDILGAHFYAVNGSFVVKVLNYMNECERRPRNHPDGGPMPVDGIYNHIRYIDPQISLFLSVPNLAYQRPSRSDISGGRALDRLDWLGGPVRIVRSIKHMTKMLLDRNKIRRQLEEP
jgi:glycosyl transferase family 25